MIPKEFEAAFASNHTNGMSLRDYFAAHAMQTYLASGSCDIDMDKNALVAYRAADALLKARAA